MTYRCHVLYVILRCQCVILDGCRRCWQKTRLGTVRSLSSTLRLVATSKRFERQGDQHAVDSPPEPDAGAAAVSRRRPGVGGAEHGRGRDRVARGHRGGECRRRRRPIDAEEVVADGRHLLEIHAGGVRRRPLEDKTDRYE